MNTYGRWIWVSVFGVLVLGCATQPPLVLSINPVTRFEFAGFSVLPPPGGNWYLGKTPYSNAVVFMKRLFETPNSPEMHTLYATVHPFILERGFETPQDLLSFIESPSQIKSHFRVVSSDVVLDNAMGSALGTDCVRYDFVEEERDNPMAPKAVFILTAHGFACRHPSSPRVLINAWCSERYPWECNRSSMRHWRRSASHF